MSKDINLRFKKLRKSQTNKTKQNNKKKKKKQISKKKKKKKKKKKFLKQRERSLSYNGKTIQFLIRTCRSRKELAHFSSAEKKKLSTPDSISGNNIFQEGKGNQDISDEEKIIEFVSR